METIIVGLLVVIVVLLLLNLFRSRAVPKLVQQEQTPLVVVDRPYYYDYPLYSYGIAPWWGWNGGGYWPYSYGSGGYSGGIRTGGGGHHGGGGGGHGGGGGGHGGGGH